MWLVYFSAYIFGYLGYLGYQLVTNWLPWLPISWLPCHMVVHVVLITAFGA